MHHLNVPLGLAIVGIQRMGVGHPDPQIQSQEQELSREYIAMSQIFFLDNRIDDDHSEKIAFRRYSSASLDNNQTRTCRHDVIGEATSLVSKQTSFTGSFEWFVPRSKRLQVVK